MCHKSGTKGYLRKTACFANTILIYSVTPREEVAKHKVFRVQLIFYTIFLQSGSALPDQWKTGPAQAAIVLEEGRAASFFPVFFLQRRQIDGYFRFFLNLLSKSCYECVLG